MGDSGSQTHNELVTGHEDFLANFESDRAFYERLANEQHPKLVWIGCSDSRVFPSVITNAKPGDLFVVRNIANVVPKAHDGSNSVGAAIEFAINHLQVEGIVVCGHSGCGGVRALADTSAIDSKQSPHLHDWVQYMLPALERCDMHGLSEAEQEDALIKANVLQQIDNLLTYDTVKTARRTGKFRLYAWVYDLQNGGILAYDTKLSEWHPLGQLP